MSDEDPIERALRMSEEQTRIIEKMFVRLLAMHDQLGAQIRDMEEAR